MAVIMCCVGDAEGLSTGGDMPTPMIFARRRERLEKRLVAVMIQFLLSVEVTPPACYRIVIRMQNS